MDAIFGSVTGGSNPPARANGWFHHVVDGCLRTSWTCPGMAWSPSSPASAPQSSFHRFEAALPNQLWQVDVTYWQLAGGRHAEILNLVDDHSRLLLASDAFSTVKAADEVRVLAEDGAFVALADHRSQSRLPAARRSKRPPCPDTSVGMSLDITLPPQPTFSMTLRS